VFEALLTVLVEITNSEYGFIGKVLQKPDSTPYLKVFALTNIAWNEKTQRLYDQHLVEGMEFHELNSIYGHVSTTEQPYISHTPPTDPHKHGTPYGHPPLMAFLGIPIIYHGMIGMVGVANRPEVYSQQMIDFLQPLTTTCAVIIEALNERAHNERAHKERANQELRIAQERTLRDAQYLRSLLDAQAQYVVRTDTQGRYTYINKAFAEHFGFGQELLGNDIMTTVHPNDMGKCSRVVEQCLAHPGLIVTAELRKPIAGGSYVETEWDFLVITNADGVASEIQCVGRDVTERKKIEAERERAMESLSHLHQQIEHQLAALKRSHEELQDRQQFLKTVLQTSPSILYIYNLPDDTVHILNMTDDVFGYEKQGLERQYAQEMMLKYTHASTHNALEKRRSQLSADATNTVYTVQMQYYTPSDEPRWALDRAAVLTRDAQGMPIQALCAWTDITELKRAEEQIRAANETLEAQVQRRTEQLLQLNQEKEELLHIAAHDLKTPLQGIVLSAGVARQHLHRGNIDKVLAILNSIEHIGAAAGETIETFLSANAIESGSFQLTLAEVPMEVIQEAVERYQLRAKEKHQVLQAEYPVVPLGIWADRVALREVVENLLSNAIKYSPPHKRVFVKVQSYTSKVRIEVRDEGPGIQTTEMPQLFGKFARLSAKPTGGEHSTGLGLNIVKKLVEAMNGRVWCESEFGKGATFIVELPAA